MERPLSFGPGHHLMLCGHIFDYAHLSQEAFCYACCVEPSFGYTCSLQENQQIREVKLQLHMPGVVGLVVPRDNKQL